jgi:small-conductance mechanosensitive channel
MAKLDESEKVQGRHIRPAVITFIGTLRMIILILVTLDLSHRNTIPFVSRQQRYILAIEATGLAVFIVELLLRLATLRLHTPKMEDQRNRIRLMVRIVGYTISAISVISILASNVTLGISAGAILGVVVAFATQNIVGSMLAAITILSTRMVRVGEEITVNQTKGVAFRCGERGFCSQFYGYFEYYAAAQAGTGQRCRGKGLVSKIRNPISEIRNVD